MRNVYVAGVGMTHFTVHHSLSVKHLAGMAVREALADARAGNESIEAAYVGNAAQGALEGQHSVRGQVMLRAIGTCITILGQQ